MKKYKLVLFAFLPVMLLNLTGCYTQVASRDNDYGNWSREEKKPYYNYEEEYDTTSEAYDNEEYAYDENEESYTPSKPVNSFSEINSLDRDILQKKFFELQS